MPAITTTARSLALSTALCAALLLASGAARALPAEAARQAPIAAPAFGVLLVHAQPQFKGSWQRQGNPQWRHDRRSREVHRAFRGRHPGYRRHGPRQRACHPVRHVGFHHGYKVLLGSIVCYDRRGRPYVLRDSGHILRYLHR